MTSIVLTTPAEDPKQALRMRRYLIAAGTCILVIGLLYVFYLLNVLEKTAFLQISAVIVFWAAVFYVLFRTGLNLISSDPSLTVPQMAVATLTILYAMYVADGARAAFLIILVMILLFGVLRLSAQTLIFFSCLPLGGYLIVIGLLWQFKPVGFDARLELLQWLVFALTLPWFGFMCGYISRLRQQLRKSNAELQSTLQAVQESELSLEDAQRIGRLGGWSFDPVTGAAKWSQQTYRIFGLDLNHPAPVAEEFRRLVYSEDQQRYEQLIGSALRELRSFDSQFRIVLPSGEVRWVHARGQPVADAKGQIKLLQGVVMDITERHAAEEQIRQLAHFDALTGLPNRNLFNQLLAHTLARAERTITSIAILYVDLDGFKEVNDRLGHDVGDRLLAGFAQRLRACLRKSDVAARLGGDEFVILIDDIARESELAIVVQRILDDTTKPFEIAGEERNISASIGISVYPRDGRDIEALVRSADRAMYDAKQGGKNNYRFF